MSSTQRCRFLLQRSLVSLAYTRNTMSRNTNLQTNAFRTFPMSKRSSFRVPSVTREARQAMLTIQAYFGTNQSQRRSDFKPMRGLIGALQHFDFTNERRYTTRTMGKLVVGARSEGSVPRTAGLLIIVQLSRLYGPGDASTLSR